MALTPLLEAAFQRLLNEQPFTSEDDIQLRVVIGPDYVKSLPKDLASGLLQRKNSANMFGLLEGSPRLQEEREAAAVRAAQQEEQRRVDALDGAETSLEATLNTSFQRLLGDALQQFGEAGRKQGIPDAFIQQMAWQQFGPAIIHFGGQKDADPRILQSLQYGKDNKLVSTDPQGNPISLTHTGPFGGFELGPFGNFGSPFGTPPFIPGPGRNRVFGGFDPFGFDPRFLDPGFSGGRNPAGGFGRGGIPPWLLPLVVGGLGGFGAGGGFKGGKQDEFKGFGGLEELLTPFITNLFKQSDPVARSLGGLLGSPQFVPQDISGFMNALAGTPIPDAPGLIPNQTINLFNQLFGQAGVGAPAPLAQAVAGTGQTLPFLQEQLAHLQRQGLPGQAILQEPGRFQELQDLARALLTTGAPAGPAGTVGGAIGTILGQGLPGQLNVQGLVPRQQSLGELLQTLSGQIIWQLAQGGGPLGAQAQASAQGLLTQPIVPPQPPSVTAGQLLAQANAGQPGFFQDLISRAFGAGTGLQTPTIGVPAPPAPPGVPQPKIQAPATLEQLRGIQVRPLGVQAPQVGVTPQPIIQDVTRTLQAMLGGGGLTPEFVEAQRRLVLEPARQALQGRLNVQGGGVATPESGLFQEILRRQERDFADQLLRTGFENLQQTIGQARGVGEFGAGISLQQQLANQQAQLEAQRLNQQAELQAPALQADIFGKLAGLETGIATRQPELGLQAALANLQAQQRGGEFGTETALRQALANQQAQLQTQALGTQAGLQGLGLVPQLAGQDIQRQLANLQLGQRAGEFNIESALRAALANQGAFQRAGEFGADLALRQPVAAAGLQEQLFNQVLRAAGLQAETGEQALGRALQAFQTVPQQVLPAIDLANQIAQQAQRSALERFQTLGGQGLDLLRTVGQLGLAPIQLGEQLRLQGRGLDLDVLGRAQAQQAQLADFFRQNIGQALQFQQAQQGGVLDASGILASILNAALSGQFQERMAGKQATGNIIGSLVSATPKLIEALKKLFGG